MLENWLKSRRNIDKESPESLYGWLDSLDGFDNTMKKILKDQTRINLKKNLKNIKECIMNYFQRDLEQIYLFRAYVNAVDKDESQSFFGKTIIGLIAGGMAASLRIIDYKFLFLFTFQKYNLISPLYEKVVTTFFYIIVIFVIISFIIFSTYKNKSRIAITKEILEICVRELEKK